MFVHCCQRKEGYCKTLSWQNAVVSGLGLQVARPMETSKALCEATLPGNCGLRTWSP